MPNQPQTDPVQGPATVTFRLDQTSASVLAQRAFRLRVSPHELAREYVLEMLHEAEERAALRAAVTALRQDIGLATATLLTSAGKVSPERAKAWAKSNFP